MSDTVEPAVRAYAQALIEAGLKNADLDMLRLGRQLERQLDDTDEWPTSSNRDD